MSFALQRFVTAFIYIPIFSCVQHIRPPTLIEHLMRLMPPCAIRRQLFSKIPNANPASILSCAPWTCASRPGAAPCGAPTARAFQLKSSAKREDRG